MKLMKSRLAAIAGLLMLATSAQASEGLMCSGDGATVDVALGSLVVVGVLGAFVDVGGQTWSTGPERGEGTPIAVGQAMTTASRSTSSTPITKRSLSRSV